jgi:[acyl-carrier-protein] S-malonyltransferase
VANICREAAQGDVLSPANFNAIGQIVLAGKAEAIARAVALAKESGAKMAKPIPVSVPSHCALMRPAAEQLAESLRQVRIKPSTISILHNADVASYTDPEQIRLALVKQLYSPVRWVETIQTLAKQGVERFVECGPGKVLAGLNKRIVPELQTVSIGTLEGLRQAI